MDKKPMPSKQRNAKNEAKIKKLTGELANLKNACIAMLDTYEGNGNIVQDLEAISKLVQFAPDDREDSEADTRHIERRSFPR